MDDPRIVDWLRLHRSRLSKLYIEAARGGEYPGFGCLSPLSLKAVTDRMVRTLIYHADRDEEGLKSVEKLHRKQSQLTAEVPMLEKLAFIEERMALTQSYIETEGDNSPFREGLSKRLVEAKRYIKITTRSVELERKMAELSGETAT